MSEYPEMVERVARAMWMSSATPQHFTWQTISANKRDAIRRAAGAAIRAMREPTEAMISEMRDVARPHIEPPEAEYHGGHLTDVGHAAAWRAGIDAALN